MRGYARDMHWGRTLCLWCPGVRCVCKNRAHVGYYTLTRGRAEKPSSNRPAGGTGALAFRSVGLIACQSGQKLGFSRIVLSREFHGISMLSLIISTGLQPRRPPALRPALEEGCCSRLRLRHLPSLLSGLRHACCSCGRPGWAPLAAAGSMPGHRPYPCRLKLHSPAAAAPGIGSG